MKLTQRLRFVAVFLVGALIAGCANSPERADLLVHNVTVYDGTVLISFKDIGTDICTIFTTARVIRIRFNPQGVEEIW